MSRETIETPARLYEAVNDGTLTILTDIACLPAIQAQRVIQANFGDANAAMALADDLAPDWTWRIGYDNRAEMVRRVPINGQNEIEVISLSPAHALLMATLQAWGK